MRYITKTLEFEALKPSAVTLGKFDGVHRGHRKLINRILELGSRDGLETVIFTFDVPPQSRLGGERQGLLLTNAERRDCLRELGADTLIECPFVPELMHMEPEEFARQILAGRLRTQTVVVGTDFRFGSQRRGTPKLLQELGKRYGFSVEILDKVMDKDREISSTYIREALGRGDMEKVTELLGRPYSLTGEIVRGHQLGRTIGVPTINQIPPAEKMLPPRGVYVSVTAVAGRIYRGITNIGIKPTVQEKFVGAETYLFGCDRELYGETAKVELYHYQRPEQKFPSVEALQEQLLSDAAQGNDYFLTHKQHGPLPAGIGLTQ